eukprot:1782243-Pyramimonas_sp.AAC.1
MSELGLLLELGPRNYSYFTIFSAGDDEFLHLSRAPNQLQSSLAQQSEENHQARSSNVSRHLTSVCDQCSSRKTIRTLLTGGGG